MMSPGPRSSSLSLRASPRSGPPSPSTTHRSQSKRAPSAPPGCSRARLSPRAAGKPPLSLASLIPSASRVRSPRSACRNPLAPGHRQPLKHPARSQLRSSLFSSRMLASSLPRSPGSLSPPEDGPSTSPLILRRPSSRQHRLRRPPGEASSHTLSSQCSHKSSNPSQPNSQPGGGIRHLSNLSISSHQAGLSRMQPRSRRARTPPARLLRPWARTSSPCAPAPA